MSDTKCPPHDWARRVDKGEEAAECGRCGLAVCPPHSTVISTEYGREQLVCIDCGESFPIGPT